MPIKRKTFYRYKIGLAFKKKKSSVEYFNMVFSFCGDWPICMKAYKAKKDEKTHTTIYKFWILKKHISLHHISLQMKCDEIMGKLEEKTITNSFF